MKNKITKEIIVSLTLIVLAVLLLNPFHFWMPDMMVMGMLAILLVLVLFGMFASFILKEKVFDERDDVNRSLAGRNAFLAGSAILMLGIVIQGYSHKVDSWLVVALIVMIIVKITTRLWSDRNL
jgi:cobalamin synthase